MKKFLSNLLFLTCWGLAFQGSALANEPPLRFGVFPLKSPKTMLTLFAPIVDRIEKQTGRKVKIVTAPNAQVFNQRYQAKEYDLAWPCSACFFAAYQKSEHYIIARGYPDFQGGVIVRKESPIVYIENTIGKNVAAIGPFSYAGYKFYNFKLKEIGYADPDSEISFSFLGNVDSIIYGVINKKYDAGVIRTDALTSKKFKKIENQLRIIYKSPPIPQFPFTVSSDLNKELVKQIQKALTSINGQHPEDKAILEPFKLKSIVESTNSDYDSFKKDLFKFKQPAS